MRAALLSALLCLGCASLVRGEDRIVDFPRSVVRVKWDGVTRCSGVLVDPHTVVTASHCVPPGAALSVAPPGAKGFPVASVAVHPVLDVAVLQLGSSLRIPPAVQGSDPAPYDGVYFVGFGCDPKNRRRDVRPGVYAVRSLLIMEPADLILYGKGCFGDSGGGVFNERGQLIGIMWGIRQDDKTKIVLATDIRALDFLNQ